MFKSTLKAKKEQMINQIHNTNIESETCHNLAH
jgi:hypothetical protein